EILTHRGRERDLVQQSSVITISIPVESLQVWRHPTRPVDLAARRHHQNLVERKSNTLPQLIVSLERGAEERSMDRIHRVVIAKTNLLVVVWICGIARRTLLSTVIERKYQVRIVRSLRCVSGCEAELFVEISHETHGFHACDFGGCRSPTRLLEKTHSVCVCGRTCICVRSQRCIRRRRRDGRWSRY